MSRDFRVFLEDIAAASGKVRKYAGRKSKKALFRDDKTVDAIVRNLEIISEAVKNLPAHTRDKNPDIEWKNLAGLRDILIHRYFGVNTDIVWDIIKNNIPKVEAKIARMLDAE